jgi:DNA repair protein RadD
MKPRPYQAQMISDARAALSDSVRRLLLVLPTGGGKTLVASLIIQSAVARGSHILFLAHRRELITQTSAKLDGLDVPHGVIMGSHKRAQPFAPVQVASVMTLTRRIHADPRDARRLRAEPDLIFVDEAHHCTAKSYRNILDAFPRAVVIGLTATPWRVDGRGLGELFQQIVAGPSIRALTEQGYLVRAKGFTYDVPDLRGVRTSAGDYNLAQLDTAMGKVLLAGDYVREWQQHAAGKRTVVFAVNVRHSKLIVEQFKAAGVPAEHVDDETPTEVREAALNRVRRGETLVISNVGLFTEGTDLPALEVAILARPTKSVALALQMIGRVLRPWCFDCGDAPRSDCVAQAHRLKDHARLHDHAGVILDHGLPEQDRDYTLTPDRKPGAAPVRRCPKCFCVNLAGATACSECGVSLRAEGESKEREIATVHGDKIDLDALRAEIDQLAAKRRAAGLPELPPLALAKISKATPPEKAAEYLRLCEEARKRGFKAGWAGFRYRDVFGAYPDYSDDFLKSISPAEEPFVRVPREAQKKSAGGGRAA